MPPSADIDSGIQSNTQKAEQAQPQNAPCAAEEPRFADSPLEETRSEPTVPPVNRHAALDPLVASPAEVTEVGVSPGERVVPRSL